jgi:hypothetical protein
MSRNAARKRLAKQQQKELRLAEQQQKKELRKQKLLSKGPSAPAEVKFRNTLREKAHLIHEGDPGILRKLKIKPGSEEQEVMAAFLEYAADHGELTGGGFGIPVGPEGLPENWTWFAAILEKSRQTSVPQAHEQRQL